MTEDEAKQKRCCVYGAGDAPGEHNFHAYYCVGSECMAWRWVGHRSAAGRARMERYGVVESVEPQENGYCGRAGEP